MYEEAINYFTGAINFKSTQNAIFALGEIYFNRGTCYEKVGDHDKAVSDLKEAAFLSPSAPTFNNLAASLSGKGDNSSALSFLNKALSLIPDPRYFQNRGWLYELLGNEEAALTNYNQAVILGARNSKVFNQRALIWQRRGNLDNAFQDFTEAIKQDPKDPAPLANRGNVFSQRGEWRQAVTDYDRAITIDLRLSSVFIDRGRAFIKLRETNRAFADWNRAILLDSNSITAYVLLGVEHLNRGEAEVAIEYFTRQINHTPDGGGFFNRAYAYRVRRNNKLAIADCNKAVQLGYTNEHVYNLRGTANAEEGLFDDAIRDFTLSIAGNPLDSAVRHNRADVYFRMSKCKEALPDLTFLLQRTNSPELWLMRADAYFFGSNFVEAIRDCEAAILGKPKYAAAYSRLGDAYWSQDLGSNAISAYDKALNYNPASEPDYLHRGEAFLSLGDRERAKKDFLHVFRISTNAYNRTSASNLLYLLK